MYRNGQTKPDKQLLQRSTLNLPCINPTAPFTEPENSLLKDPEFIETAICIIGLIGALCLGDLRDPTAPMGTIGALFGAIGGLGGWRGLL